MQVLFLAAGFATRLYPLTKDRAKPLLDVRGRPVLSWIADVALGLPEIEAVTVVSNRKFHRQFVDWAHAYGAERRLDHRIDVVDDGAMDDAEKLGGIGDLHLGLQSMADSDDDVLVLAGDNLLEFALDAHWQRFRQLGAPMMLARLIDGAVPPKRYGEVVVDDRSRIVSMREKPADPQSQWTATCIYFLDRQARRALADYLAQEDERDAPGHFIAWLSRRQPVFADPIRGTLHDIGNRESLERAREVFAPVVPPIRAPQD